MEKSSSFHGVSSTVGAAIVAVLAVIFVGLRFYARKRYKSGIAWDDWWILIGLLITLLEGALLLASTLTHMSPLDVFSANNTQASTWKQRLEMPPSRPLPTRQPHSTQPSMGPTSSSPSCAQFCTSPMSPPSKSPFCSCIAASFTSTAISVVSLCWWA